MPEAQAIALGGGVATFLLGEALFRHTLGLVAARERALGAALAAATIPIGEGLSAALQLLVLLALFLTMLNLQARRARGGD